MLAPPSARIEMLPIDQIHILNPRVRNQAIFHEIAENITKVGLKRPITVMRAASSSARPYELVCGQGRLEAYLACGQTHIPAIIVTASEEEALVMSLVENLARKQHRSLDLLQGIALLQQKGYNVKTIAAKTGLSVSYTHGVLELLERGEERLIIGVEAGHLPLSVAVAIAQAPNDEQKALQEAYEKNELRGAKLKMARVLLERRKHQGKSIKNPNGPGGHNRKKVGAISSQDVLKIYQKEVDRKRSLTRKADLVQNRLLFISEALRHLLAQEHFLTLLRAEGLMTLPTPLKALLEESR